MEVSSLQHSDSISSYHHPGTYRLAATFISHLPNLADMMQAIRLHPTICGIDVPFPYNFSRGVVVVSGGCRYGFIPVFGVWIERARWRTMMRGGGRRLQRTTTTTKTTPAPFAAVLPSSSRATKLPKNQHVKADN